MSTSARYLDELTRRPPLTERRERRLVTGARGGDARATTELIEAFLPAIVSMSRHFEGDADALELIQEGVMALLRALKCAGAGTAEAEYELVACTAERRELRELLATLSKRERAVLGALRGGGRDPRTPDEVGERLGLTAEQVRRIEQRAMGKLAAGAGRPRRRA
jgi:DNA-directed RNA polymerase sigma subunit (sigma70/sigma32)